MRNLAICAVLNGLILGGLTLLLVPGYAESLVGTVMVSAGILAVTVFVAERDGHIRPQS